MHVCCSTMLRKRRRRSVLAKSKAVNVKVEPSASRLRSGRIVRSGPKVKPQRQIRSRTSVQASSNARARQSQNTNVNLSVQNYPGYNPGRSANVRVPRERALKDCPPQQPLPQSSFLSKAGRLLGQAALPAALTAVGVPSLVSGAVGSAFGSVFPEQGLPPMQNALPPPGSDGSWWGGVLPLALGTGLYKWWQSKRGSGGFIPAEQSTIVRRKGPRRRIIRRVHRGTRPSPMRAALNTPVPLTMGEHRIIKRVHTPFTVPGVHALVRGVHVPPQVAPNIQPVPVGAPAPPPAPAHVPQQPHRPAALPPPAHVGVPPALAPIMPPAQPLARPITPPPPPREFTFEEMPRHLYEPYEEERPISPRSDTYIDDGLPYPRGEYDNMSDTSATLPPLSAADEEEFYSPRAMSPAQELETLDRAYSPEGTVSIDPVYEPAQPGTSRDLHRPAPPSFLQEITERELHRPAPPAFLQEITERAEQRPQPPSFLQELSDRAQRLIPFSKQRVERPQIQPRASPRDDLMREILQKAARMREQRDKEPMRVTFRRRPPPDPTPPPTQSIYDSFVANVEGRRSRMRYDEDPDSLLQDLSEW